MIFCLYAHEGRSRAQHDPRGDLARGGDSTASSGWTLNLSRAGTVSRADNTALPVMARRTVPPAAPNARPALRVRGPVRVDEARSNRPPLLGGDPMSARLISPPMRHLTWDRTPQGRGRPIASQVQGRVEQSRMGEAQCEAPPKASLTARHGPHTSRAGGPGRRPVRRSLKLPTLLTAGPSGVTSTLGRFQRSSSEWQAGSLSGRVVPQGRRGSLHPEMRFTSGSSAASVSRSAARVAGSTGCRARCSSGLVTSSEAHRRLLASSRSPARSRRMTLLFGSSSRQKTAGSPIDRPAARTMSQGRS